MSTPRHPYLEDLQALLTASLLAALGIMLFRHAGLVPGGTVGIALLLHYATSIDLGWALLVANAPFYALACFRMGREFTVKTLAAVALMALFTMWLPQGLSFQNLSAPLAALLGGLLCGVSILVLFRHKASLGGLNVLVLYLQERFGWSPGKVQMGLDALVVLGGGLLVADASRIGASIIAVVTLNMVLAVNHRPGRYQPT
ncbi:MAG: YitT family protein [Burkholderiales bacterium]|nr:YitT family protein [Burkholderiales bacterium]